MIDLNTLDRDQFVELLGGVYEHSPWVAELAWTQHQTSQIEGLDGLQSALQSIVDNSSKASRLALIRAHPDLAGRTAQAKQLSAASSREQTGAGLDQCSGQEFKTFQQLNQQYTDKFGFPFVVAVAGLSRADILSQFQTRLKQSAEAEFATAIEQIHKIAQLRLNALFTDQAQSVSQAPSDGFRRSAVNLADPRLGAKVIYATDDFFADKQRLIDPSEPIFVPDKYDQHGKWMDGWESRRRRDAAHDWCVIELGQPAVLDQAEINTQHFNGNQPLTANLEAIYCPDQAPSDSSQWQPICNRIALGPDQRHQVMLHQAGPWTHIRLNIFPDGGVARLRLFGHRQIDWQQRDRQQLIDLAAIENGGYPVACNDEHFGRLSNILAPGRGINMGDGWETRRRREPGHDWAIIRLGHIALIEQILVDTAHFKGNFPDRLSIQASGEQYESFEAAQANSKHWPILLPEQALQADAEEVFVEPIVDHQPVCWARINLFPDGGISRLRMLGNVVT